MSKGQLKRIQQDLIKEVEDCDGGNFTEKLRNWRTKYIEEELPKTIESLDRNNSLTRKDVRESVEEALETYQRGQP